MSLLSAPSWQLALTVLLVTLFGPLGRHPVRAQEPVPKTSWRAPVDRIASQRFAMHQHGSTLYAPYVSSQPIDQPDPNITRLVYLQHGAARNPYAYLERFQRAARLGDASDHTLVIAGQFLEEKDIEKHQPGDDVLYYSGNWRAGNRSQSTDANPRPFRISNFVVIDRMLTAAVRTFPNLTSVVVAGHSAGGQVVNRYAMTNEVEPILEQEHGLSVRYVVANPSSYLYLNGKRWDEGSQSFQ
ncbi:MAG: hypothetical protein AAGA03_17350, partial [Planctomycetota bacterium]